MGETEADKHVNGSCVDRFILLGLLFCSLIAFPPRLSLWSSPFALPFPKGSNQPPDCTKRERGDRRNYGESYQRTQTYHLIHRQESQDNKEEVKGRETIFRHEENFPWRAHFRHNCSEGEGQGNVQEIEVNTVQ